MLCLREEVAFEEAIEGSEWNFAVEECGEPGGPSAWNPLTCISLPRVLVGVVLNAV
jgi:hypothetical protein